MSRYDFDVSGCPEPPEGAGQFFAAVVLAAILTVLVAWLWIGQDDIRRQRREIPAQSPRPPLFPSRIDPVIAAAAAEGEL